MNDELHPGETRELRRTTEEGGWTKIHLALSDERPDVSRLWAPTFGMRIGSAVVSMGGIAGVGTDEAHRLRGYSRLVLDGSTRYFAETGHDIAVLFGIPDFYHRFGYAPVLPVTTLTIKVRDALLSLPENSSAGYKTRPLEEGDWRTALDLYDANNAARTGTLLRPRDRWQGFRHGTEWSSKTETYVAVDGSGAVAGYLAMDAVDDACRVGDLGYRTPGAFPVLLAMMTEQARRRNLEAFEAKLPPDHPFTVFCRRCGASVRTVYERDRGGMARIIGLRSLLEKLDPLLTERLRVSPFAGAGGALELQTDLGAVTLQLDNGQVRITDDSPPTLRARLPQMRLTQLVMGFRSVEDVALEDDVDVPPDTAPLLDVLFPVGHPWMPIPDWF